MRSFIRSHVSFSSRIQRGHIFGLGLFLIVCVGILLPGAQASGAAIAAVGNADGNWSDGTRWIGGNSPGAGDDVGINVGSNIIYDGAASNGPIGSIDVNRGGQEGPITFNANSTSLTLQKNLRVTGQVHVHRNDAKLFMNNFTLDAGSLLLSPVGGGQGGIIYASPDSIIRTTGAFSITNADPIEDRVYVTQTAGQTTGLTLKIGGTMSFTGTNGFTLNFDGGSGANDWGLRWLGNHTTELNTFIANGNILANVPLSVVVKGSYTYVAASSDLSGVEEPQIGVLGGSPLSNVAHDPSGVGSPGVGNGTAFTAIVGGAPVVHLFSVGNSGAGNLNLIGPSTVTGANSNAFSISTQPTGTVLPNSNTSLGVSMSTSTIGNFSGQVSMYNDDADEGPFRFNVSGTVLDHADAEFVGGAADTLSLDFGPLAANGGVTSLSYQIENLAAALRAGLDLDSVLEISDDSGVFSTSAAFTTLAPGNASGFFDLFFDTTGLTAGTYTAHYQFNLHDDHAFDALGGTSQQLDLFVTADILASAVPEPGTYALGLLAAVGCAAVVWRRGRRPLPKGC